MRNFWRYSINPESNILFEKKEDFLEELALIAEADWYYHPHFFDENNVLKSYWTFVIRLPSYDQESIQHVKATYGIIPTQIIQHTLSKTCHLIFDIELWIGKEEYQEISKSLAIVYGWDYIPYHYYNDTNSVRTKSISFTNEKFESFSDIKSIWHFLRGDPTSERKRTKSELVAINEVNNLSIIDIAQKLWIKDEKIDWKLNLSVRFWKPYNFILNQFKLPAEARRWIQETYGIKIQDYVDITKYRGIWEKIIEWDGFFLDEVWYYMVVEWEKKRMTDFFVNVHYKIKKSDTETTFIVTLVNEISWCKSNKVEWTNKVWLTPFTEFCQAIGNFHFYGGKTFISKLHNMISNYQDLPEIEVVQWFWFHPDLQIAIFENWVFDLKEKIFTEKVVLEDPYYFNYNGKWYVPKGVQWSDIYWMLKWMIPAIRSEWLVTAGELFQVFSGLYKWYLGKFACMIVFGALGYAMYSKKWTDDTYPFFFVRGTTGSGKTSYMRLIQRMFWIPWSAKHFDTTTNFILSVLLSNLNYTPLFLTEYREWRQDTPAKISTLRAVYDKTWASKWRADQSIVNYNYKWLPMIDWEEMIEDPATRTRCLQIRFLWDHKIDDNFSKLSQEAYPILDKVLNSYLQLSDWDKYNQYMDEWFELFKSISRNSNRVWLNLKMVYAGCMAFDDSFRDEYIKILTLVWEFQNTDVSKNSNYAQIIKAIARFIEQCDDFYNYVIIHNGKIVISWWPFEDFIKRKRIDLSLKLDTYKEHLEENGFNIGYIDSWDKLIYWIIFEAENTPKEFLVNKDIYEVTKRFRPKMI